MPFTKDSPIFTAASAIRLVLLPIPSRKDVIIDVAASIIFGALFAACVATSANTVPSSLTSPDSPPSLNAFVNCSTIEVAESTIVRIGVFTLS